MEVHRQQCQACGSRQMQNILVRESDQPMTVFVRCLECDELVARYRLRGYYHHGKGIESFLKSLGPEVGESGRKYLEEFNQAQEESVAGYEKALEELKRTGRDGK